MAPVSQTTQYNHPDDGDHTARAVFQCCPQFDFTVTVVTPGKVEMITCVSQVMDPRLGEVKMSKC